MTSALSRIGKLRSRLFVRKAVTTGHRIELERQFQRELYFQTRLFLKESTRYLDDRGYLKLVLMQAKSIQRVPFQDRKRVINKSLDSIFNFSELSQMVQFESFRALTTLYSKWFRIMYELGAVTALRSMGIRSNSLLVDAALKHDTAKTAEYDGFRKRRDAAIIAAILFGLDDQEILFALDNRAILFTRGSANEFIRLIREIVSNNVYLRAGVNTSFSQQQLADAISQNTQIPQWKSRQIVTTETQQSFSFGMNDMFRRSGVRKHTWWSVGDERVRPAHRLNDGVTVEIGKLFPSGQLHTGDGPLAINCRCHTTAEFMGILITPWDGGPGGPESSVSPPRSGAVPTAITGDITPHRGRSGSPIPV